MKRITVECRNATSTRATEISLETQADLLELRLQDAAALRGRGAVGLLRPKSTEQLACWLRDNPKQTVMTQGALTSLTGGATPDGDVVVSTEFFRKLSVDSKAQSAVVGAGVLLARIQEELAPYKLFYPPAPTYDGASIGGSLATNAAGAATYRYGTTRDWVDSVTMVLSGGQIVRLKRGEYGVCPGDRVEFFCDGSCVAAFSIPQYKLPDVKKISCGPYVREQFDLIDLFIGHEGTLSIITEATLKLASAPPTCLMLSSFLTQKDCAQFVEHMRKLESGNVSVRSMEFFDRHCLEFLKQQNALDAFVPGDENSYGLVLTELEVPQEMTGVEQQEAFLTSIEGKGGVFAGAARALEDSRCLQLTEIAFSHQEKRKVELKAIREAIPMHVSEWLKEGNRNNQAVSKMAGDFIVPMERFWELMKAYREVFEENGLRFLIYGHISDGNVHPNILPANAEQMHLAKMAFIELAKKVKTMGGAPMSEHGVGKHPLKKQLFSEFWGPEVIEKMKQLKRELDSNLRLNPGVYFDFN